MFLQPQILEVSDLKLRSQQSLVPPKNCGPVSLLAHGYLVLHQTGVRIFDIKSVVSNKNRFITGNCLEGSMEGHIST